MALVLLLLQPLAGCMPLFAACKLSSHGEKKDADGNTPLLQPSSIQATAVPAAMDARSPTQLRLLCPTQSSTAFAVT